jgi:hypothetical protein
MADKRPFSRLCWAEGQPDLDREDGIIVSTGLELRAIAQAYSVFATGGRELGLRQETLRELMAPAVPPLRGFYDEFLKFEVPFSLGFQKPCPLFPYDQGNDPRKIGCARQCISRLISQSPPMGVDADTVFPSTTIWR